MNTISQTSLITDAFISLLAASFHRPFSNHKTVTVKTPEGIFFTHRTRSMDATIIVENCYVKVYERFLHSLVSHGDIIDIGGHIGVPSIPLALKFPNSRILSFEPCPQTYALLKTNIRQNHLTSRIIPIQKAVAAAKRSIRLYLDPANTGGNSTQPHSPSPRSIEVEATTLPHIFSQYSIKRCGLLHIDAEGYEYEILKAVSSSILSKIDAIICEYQTKESLHLMKSLLTVNGFDVEVTDGIPIFPLNKLIHIPLMVAKRNR